MNLKVLLCIAMGVFVAHMAAFMIFFTIRTRQMPTPPPPPQPNFKYAEQIVKNPETGDRYVNREITVTTKLRTEMYQGRETPPATK